MKKLKDGHFAHAANPGEYPEIIRAAGLSQNFKLIKDDGAVYVAPVSPEFAGFVEGAAWPMNALAYERYIGIANVSSADPALFSMVSAHTVYLTEIERNWRYK